MPNKKVTKNKVKDFLYPQESFQIKEALFGEKVGTYVPDLIINDCILVELKAKPFLTKEDERQFWYYLRGSQYKLGFLVNFSTQKLEIKRRIYDKARCFK